MNLKSGFWQVKVSEESRQYTAFTVSSMGVYKFLHMLYGLCNTPATFQCLTQNCLGELSLSFAMVYLEDMIVYSEMPEDHLTRLQAVFHHFAYHGLKLKPSKCHFFKEEISYLGHEISDKGMLPGQKSIEEIAPGKNILVRDHDSKVFKPKYLDYCVVKMAGKNQVLVKDKHSHETKVHRRDLKVIDSDTKVAEMYDELRKEGRRDAQHCMPVKQIPNLEWEKENTEEQNTKQNTRNEKEKGTGPMLRSSKNKQTVNKVKEQVEAVTNKGKEHICADFLSVAGTVIAAGVYTVGSQFINTHFFYLQTIPDPHHTSAIHENITNTK